MSNILFKLNYIKKEQNLKLKPFFSKTKQTIQKIKTEINSNSLMTTIYKNQILTKHSLTTLKYNSWFLERNLIIYKKLLKTTELNYYLNFPYHITETIRMRYKYKVLRKKIFFLYLSNHYISLLSTLILNKYYNNDLLQSCKHFYKFLQKKNSKSKILKLFFFKTKKLLTVKKNNFNMLTTYNKRTQTIQILPQATKTTNNLKFNFPFLLKLKKFLKKKILSNIFKYSLKYTCKKIILTYIQTYLKKLEKKLNKKVTLTKSEIKILILQLLKNLLEKKNNLLFFKKINYIHKYKNYLNQLSSILLNNLKKQQINPSKLLELKYSILFHKKLQTPQPQLHILNLKLYNLAVLAKPTKLTSKKQFNFLKLRLWRFGRISNYYQLKKTITKHQRKTFKIPYSFISLTKIDFSLIENEIKTIPQIYFFENSLVTDKAFVPLFLNILLFFWKIQPLTLQSVFLLKQRYTVLQKLIFNYSKYKHLNDKNSTN